MSKADKPLVLVAEDDPAWIKTIRRVLRQEPLDLLVLSGEKPAVVEIGDRVPAVAVIDWHLHENTSRELIESIVLSYPQCVPMVFSGDPRPETREQARRAGAWWWVNKQEGLSLPSFVNLALREHDRRQSEEAMGLDERNGLWVAEEIRKFNGNLSAAARSLKITRGRAERIYRKWRGAA